MRTALVFAITLLSLTFSTQAMAAPARTGLVAAVGDAGSAEAPEPEVTSINFLCAYYTIQCAYWSAQVYNNCIAPPTPAPSCSSDIAQATINCNGAAQNCHTAQQ